MTRYSTRSIQITRNSLERAIRHGESNDLVGGNVAALRPAPYAAAGATWWLVEFPARGTTTDLVRAVIRDVPAVRF